VLEAKDLRADIALQAVAGSHAFAVWSLI